MDEVERQIEILIHGSRAAREAAATALREVGAAAVLPLCRALELQADASGAWPAISLAVAACRDGVHDPEPNARKKAAEELGKTGDPSAAPYLIALVLDPDARVRRAAAEALGELRDPVVLPALRQALRDTDYEVPRRAVEAVGKLGPAGVPLLLEALDAKDPLVRRAAAGAMGKSALDRDVPALSRLLNDENEGVRQTALSAMGQTERSGAIDTLCGLLADRRPTIRRGAAAALAAMGEAAIPALCALLKDARPASRQGAAEVLARIAERGTCRALADAAPPLRALLVPWRVPEAERWVYRSALDRIEGALRTARLPFPADGPAGSRRGLPRPAAAPAADPAGVPGAAEPQPELKVEG